MIRLGIFLLAIFAIEFVAAPGQVPAGAFLASALRDPGVAGATGLVDFRMQTNPQLSRLERVELRTETNRFELQRQEYLTRFSVNGRYEKRRYRELQQRETALLQAEGQQQLHNALADRYAFLAENRKISNLLPLRQELYVLYSDRINVLRQLLAAGVKTDVDDLMKAEYDRDELLLQQMEDSAALQVLYRQMAFAMSVEQIEGIDTAGQIHPLQLPAVLGASGFEPTLSDPVEQQYSAKIQALQMEYRLEKAESDQVLDFFQMRYANRANEPWRNDIALSLGLRFPYSGSGKAKMAETAIKQYEAGLELDQYRIGRAQVLQTAILQLETLEKQFLRRQQMLSDREQAYDLPATLAQGPDGILALLQHREAQIKRRIRLEEIASDMMETYLMILEVSGRLSTQPLVNYLSAGLERI
jgi:hypothetical protein